MDEMKSFIELEAWNYKFDKKNNEFLDLTTNKEFNIGDIVYYENKDKNKQYLGLIVGFLHKNNITYVIAWNSEIEDIGTLKDLKKDIFRKGVKFYNDYGIWGINLTAKCWAKNRERLGNLTQFGAMDIKDIKLKEKNKMTNIWEILVIDKTKDEIICREVVIDGDEKSACSKVSIRFAEKLKDLIFDNLEYIAKNLGSYESRKK